MKRPSLFRTAALGLLIAASATTAGGAAVTEPADSGLITLRDQGTFSVGGRTADYGGTFSMSRVYSPEGQRAYGDHAVVTYQVPAPTRRFPLLFLHGGGMTKRCWSTTPDGRDGFQNLFLRRGFPVYLIDQPRIGEAAVSAERTVPGSQGTLPAFNSRAKFTLFRLGEWPKFYPGVQFPTDSASIDQFLRQGAMMAGAEDRDLTAGAVAALLDVTGPAILVTHSANGTVGWRTALRSRKLKAIVSYEPGGGRFGPFIFPKDEMPDPIPTYWGDIEPMAVEPDEFRELTRIPIIIYYGDNIATQPVPDAGRDQWRGELEMARRFAETINRHGGDCTVVHLPELGIKGNTHFPFMDLNNREIAALMENFLREKGLADWTE